MAAEFGGSLPESWQLRRLDEVATIIDSLHKTPTYSESGTAMVRVTDVQGGFLDVSKALRVSESVFKEFTSRYVPKRGDIVFSRVGSYGKASYVMTESPFCLGQNTALISPRINGRFLHFFLESAEARRQIEELVVGSTQKTISLRSISALQVPVPPPEELEAIAHILGALDDKIELNRGMNGTLEAIARALFKSWFIDFDPVRSKIEGRESSLPKHLADLFPDSFEDSETGEIPKGWKVGSIVDWAVLNPEVWTKQTRPIHIQYVDLSNAKWGRIETISNYQGADTPSRAQRVLRLGDTIVGTVRPGNGSYSFISEVGLTGSTGFAVLRPRAPQYGEFIYLAATDRENIETLAHLADGGAYPAVRPDVVAATPVVRPDQKIVEQFSLIVKPLISKMAYNEKESRTLASLRDTLLPKLISGELRLKDAKRFLTKVL